MAAVPEAAGVAGGPGNARTTYETIRLDLDGPIATLALDRPNRLNAFTIRMGKEVVDAFDACDGDDAVRAVIVTGEGRASCAGADLGGGTETFSGAAGGRGASGPDGWPSVARDPGGVMNLRIFASTKPVIAAINGPAVGVGATMTLPMDIRLMSDRAKVGFVFAGRGIVIDGAASWLLPRVVGIDKALEWCLTARVFGADEALAGGLVRSVHPADELLPAARALAAEIAANTAPVSASVTRTLLWRMLGAAHPMEAHRVESVGIAHTGAGADAAEGIKAFLEKRPAAWRLAVPRDLPEWFPWWEEPLLRGRPRRRSVTSVVVAKPHQPGGPPTPASASVLMRSRVASMFLRFVRPRARPNRAQ